MSSSRCIWVYLGVFGCIFYTFFYFQFKPTAVDSRKPHILAEIASLNYTKFGILFASNRKGNEQRTDLANNRYKTEGKGRICEASHPSHFHTKFSDNDSFVSVTRTRWSVATRKWLRTCNLGTTTPQVRYERQAGTFVKNFSQNSTRTEIEVYSMGSALPRNPSPRFFLPGSYRQDTYLSVEILEVVK